MVSSDRKSNQWMLQIGRRFSRRGWLLFFFLFDVLIVYGIATSVILVDAWNFVIRGIGVTVQITIWSFLLALIIGLVTAFGRISKNLLIYNFATFYVEIFRGLPLLVIILIFAFVVTPAIVDWVAESPLDNLAQIVFGADPELIATTTLRTRDIDSVWRIMLAFALTYGAFMSEVFRAGIESIGYGQMEAARSLGMNYVQAMRFIILPQAIRNVLPALANNFVFLLKDTSLASVVAVPEISQLTRQYSSNNFRYPEGLLVLSFIYANLTIVLSMLANYLEIRLQGDRR
jgi:polar amino acid transport system permease protein